MQKIIELEDSSKIKIICEGDIILVQKGFIDDDGNIKTISFSKRGDYLFEGYSLNDDNKLDFEFDQNDPLYNHLNKLLKGDNQLIIDDDLTRELNKKIMTIYKKQDKIIVSIENNLNNPNFIEKFNICVINVAYDLRSKIDRQSIDTKERLNEFFDSIYMSFFKELQPQKIKK